MIKLAILGSTGSVGRQALQVVDSLPGALKPVALAAGGNRELLLAQTRRYGPAMVTLANESDAVWLKNELGDQARTEVYYGREGLWAAAASSGAETVLTAISGAAGLEPTLAAIRAGKNIALANKETLVAAGELVMEEVRRRGVKMTPVDSEHSAVWQCLNGENPERIARIILTASGGPFRNWAREEMKNITTAMALNHPNWAMGPKITVDSATLMNKGLEVIEARWLFDVDYDRIKVVIHPQSIIHSMVEYNDGSVLAQLGVPDMRLPIQHALLFPHRLDGGAPRLEWPVRDLTFEEPDLERFPGLALAYEAGREGKTAPAVFNAANEVAVGAFLAGQIGFTAITELVAAVLHAHHPVPYRSLDELLEVDRRARAATARLVRGE
ncbi:MAG: 1-deoxy-D-xylulose-5-phosphate reductoisomerase [Firmicutes bacterium]|nr:1-deoxy-D-xylulose-5-phosphate reductoisomerase [Bacillota bacterium]